MTWQAHVVRSLMKVITPKLLLTVHRSIILVITVITPEKFIHKFYYYLLIIIELYFNNFKPLTCFSVMIPDAVQYSFDPPDDEHIVLETCSGI